MGVRVSQGGQIFSKACEVFCCVAFIQHVFFFIILCVYHRECVYKYHNSFLFDIVYGNDQNIFKLNIISLSLQRILRNCINSSLRHDFPTIWYY